MVESNSNLEEILKYLDEADEGNAIFKGLESDTVRKDAQKKLRDYALRCAENDRLYIDTASGEMKPLGREKLEEDLRKMSPQEAFERVKQVAITGINNYRLGNATRLIASGGKDAIRGEQLFELINDEDFVKEAEGKERQILDYALYKHCAEHADDIEKGKLGVPKRLMEDLAKYSKVRKERNAKEAEEAASKQWEAAIEFGEAAARVTSEIVAFEKMSRGESSFKDGLNELVAEAEKELGDTVSKDYKGAAVDCIASVIERLAKSTNKDKEAKARDCVYRAYRGAGIGEKDFKDYVK